MTPEPPHERRSGPDRGPGREPTHRDLMERLERIEEVVRRLDERV